MIKSILPLFFLLHSLPFGPAEKANLPAKYKKWIEEEVVYIISPKERDVFYRLESNRERELFIEEFWKVRDPTPGTPRNEYKEEHYRRIEYANKTFIRNSPLPGWRTDRGRIYIMLGKPGHIQRFSDMQIYPFEIWYYSGNPKFGQAPLFRLLFFQRGGSGEYKLYSPLSDGPRSLVPFIWSGGPNEQDAEAFKYLKENISDEAAAASYSCFLTGKSDTAGNLAVPSVILLSQIHTYPYKKYRDDYVYDFLEHRATVDVSYSAHHIGNQNAINVLQSENELCFVNYAIAPETLSVSQYENEYSTNLKITLRVTDKEEKTIFQREQDFAVALSKEQLKKIGKRPFHLCDAFPLISGTYKINVLLENAVSSEFTSFEKAISVPEPKSIWMSPLVLCWRIDRDSPYQDVSKAFQVGSLQLYPSLRNRFYKKDTFYVFFQILNLEMGLKEEGIVEVSFLKENERIQDFKQKIADYESDRDFLFDFPLNEIQEGQYLVKASLLDREGNEVLSEVKGFTVQDKPLPESWILTQTNPPANDPFYSWLLGSQYLLKGELAKARGEFEKACDGSPDSLDYALDFAKALLMLREFKKTYDILFPFALSKREDFRLFYFLGKACQEEGKLEEAIESYQKALTHRGDVVDILNSIGECHYLLGDNEEALRAWQKSLELKPDQERIKTIIEIVRDEKREP